MAVELKEWALVVIATFLLILTVFVGIFVFSHDDSAIIASQIDSKLALYATKAELAAALAKLPPGPPGPVGPVGPVSTSNGNSTITSVMGTGLGSSETDLSHIISFSSTTESHRFKCDLMGPVFGTANFTGSKLDIIALGINIRYSCAGPIYMQTQFNTNQLTEYLILDNSNTGTNYSDPRELQGVSHIPYMAPKDETNVILSVFRLSSDFPISLLEVKSGKSTSKFTVQKLTVTAATPGKLSMSMRNTLAPSEITDTKLLLEDQSTLSDASFYPTSGSLLLQQTSDDSLIIYEFTPITHNGAHDQIVITYAGYTITFVLSTSKIGTLHHYKLLRSNSVSNTDYLTLAHFLKCLTTTIQNSTSP